MAQRRSTGKEAQAKGEARRASLEELRNKRPLTKEVTVYSGETPLSIVVSSIGRKAYADLVDKFTEEIEVDEVDEDGKVVLDDKGKPKKVKEEKLDEQNFFPALIAASASDPEIPLELAKEWVDTWNATEFDNLALAAWEVNTRDKIDRQGNA